ncbi:MAG: deoxyribodipyrimidine photolyase, partial [Acidimicrobiia bacterium]
DGRDPNSYANVAWCFGLHDRPWPEREVFGKVRTMTSGGLRSKKDADGYVARIERLTGARVES